MPVGTSAYLVDCLVCGLRRSVQLILRLCLDQQHLGITDVDIIGIASGILVLGIVDRINVFPEQRHLEGKVLSSVGIVETFRPTALFALVGIIHLFIKTDVVRYEYRLRITPSGCERTVSCHIIQISMLDRKDVLRTILLVCRKKIKGIFH